MVATHAIFRRCFWQVDEKTDATQNGDAEVLETFRSNFPRRSRPLIALGQAPSYSFHSVSKTRRPRFGSRPFLSVPLLPEGIAKNGMRSQPLLDQPQERIALLRLDDRR